MDLYIVIEKSHIGTIIPDCPDCGVSLYCCAYRRTQHLNRHADSRQFRGHIGIGVGHAQENLIDWVRLLTERYQGVVEDRRSALGSDYNGNYRSLHITLDSTNARPIVQIANHRVVARSGLVHLAATWIIESVHDANRPAWARSTGVRCRVQPTIRKDRLALVAPLVMQRIRCSISEL